MRTSPVIKQSPEELLPRAYEQLIEALYSVRAACPTIPVLAIPWMHPKHPIHSVQQELLHPRSTPHQSAGSRPGSPAVKIARRLLATNSYILRLVLCGANGVRLSAKLALLRWHQRRNLAFLRGKHFDIVAKTWCFGLKRPPGTDDFYLGNLQQRLSARGIHSLLLCGDSSGSNWLEFSDAQVSTAGPIRLPELCLVPPALPLKMAWLQFDSSRKLKRIAEQTTDALVKRVALTARLDVLLPSVTEDGFFYWIGREVVRTWKPRAFVTLYEGHGWEKCAWWGAKAEDSKTHTVGYQHTVVFPEALALIRPFVDIRDRSVPDLVLALGKQTGDLLKSSHEANNSRVISFGSFRYRQQPAATAAPSERRCVLVLPEGLPSEIKTLFEFAHRCASLLPQYKFILRSHPDWPIHKALTHLKLDVLNLPNMVVSDQQAIDEDFAKASLLLYRGSSAALYGILAGLLPVYVRVEGQLNSDPLYALSSWRQACSTAEQFVDEVMQYEAMTAIQRQTEWRKAASYVGEYTIPVDDRSIDSFLAALHLPVEMPS